MGYTGMFVHTTRSTNTDDTRRLQSTINSDSERGGVNLAISVLMD